MNLRTDAMTIKAFKPDFRLVFWTAAILLLGALLVYAFWPKSVLVDIGEVTRGELVVEVSAEGKTRVRDLYVVAAPLSGRLQRIGNRTGEAVRKGDVVARLDPSEAALLDPRSRAEAQAALAAATAALSLAHAQLAEAEAVEVDAAKEAERARTLFAKQVVSRSAVDRATMNLESASARVAAARAAQAVAEADRNGARLRLDPPKASADGARLRELRAPANGKILRVHIQSEAIVAAGTPILEIGDPGRLEIVAEFLSEDAAKFRPGADVLLTGWGGPPLAGRVRAVEPSGFLKISALGVEEQRVNVIIDLVEPPADLVLSDGFRVDAAVTVGTSQDVLRVPVSALFRDQEAWSVFRVEDGRVQLTTVELGDQNQSLAAVISGLSEGDRVVLYPDRSLTDGQSVRQRVN
jgi:HlyD family secretion protein